MLRRVLYRVSCRVSRPVLCCASALLCLAACQPQGAGAPADAGVETAPSVLPGLRGRAASPALRPALARDAGAETVEANTVEAKLIETAASSSETAARVGASQGPTRPGLVQRLSSRLKKNPDAKPESGTTVGGAADEGARRRRLRRVGVRRRGRRARRARGRAQVRELRTRVVLRARGGDARGRALRARPSSGRRPPVAHRHDGTERPQRP